MIASVTLFATNAGATSKKWQTWTKHVTPGFDQMDSTYKLIGTSLVANEVARAEELFQTYSLEAVWFAGNDNSPSKVINGDVTTLSRLSNTWAWIGYTTLIQNATSSGPSPFTTTTNELIAALKKFTHDLSVYE